MTYYLSLALHSPSPRVLGALGPRSEEEMNIRLAYGGPPKAIAKGLCEEKDAPAILVSYVYLSGFLKHRAPLHYRDWVLDSGAYSAANMGKTIELSEYIECAKELMATDKKLTEVFALDVIGDHKASLRNVEKMWEAGVPAIPTFHPNEPEDALTYIAKTYPKIAIGGMVGKDGAFKERWIGQVFARVWPKKIHGFGIGGEKIIMKFPFHSVDATNWEIGPCAFGRWQSFGQLSIRGGNQNLRAEVDGYLKLERRANERWRKEMAILDETPGTAAPPPIKNERQKNKPTKKAAK